MPEARPILDVVLDEPAAGVNLAPGTLRDQLGDELRLLVFLRHFGCMFCRETLADMRQVVREDGRIIARASATMMVFAEGEPR